MSWGKFIWRKSRKHDCVSRSTCTTLYINTTVQLLISFILPTGQNCVVSVLIFTMEKNEYINQKKEGIKQEGVKESSSLPADVTTWIPNQVIKAGIHQPARYLLPATSCLLHIDELHYQSSLFLSFLLTLCLHKDIDDTGSLASVFAVLLYVANCLVQFAFALFQQISPCTLWLYFTASP